MIRFTTETGSIYEVLPEEKKIRRASKTEASGTTKRVSEEWKTYHSLSSILPDANVAIVWTDDEPPLDDTFLPGPVLKTTITSPVASVETVEA